MVGSSLPPGFRFHPTDEELVGYYLHRRNEGLQIELEVIPLIDLYKFDPWELPEKSFLPNRDMEWFFFCPRDRKYPNGSRTNRATKSGYWKATGKDRKIVCQSSSSSSSSSSVMGYRKTLVFYHGRAPLGDRTEWVMHEYRLSEDTSQGSQNFKGAFVLCRVIKRREQTQKKRESNEPLTLSISPEITCPTSYPQNESHHSSPVVSPYPYEVTTRMASLYSESGTSNICVLPDFILESSKLQGYSQAEDQSAFQYFSQHDVIPSLTQFKYSEFPASPPYRDFNWAFEDSAEFYMNGDIMNYEIYDQSGSVHVNSFSFSPGQNSF